MLTESWGDNLGGGPSENWLWTGFLGAGLITLLTAFAKTGKTTLLSHFLAHRHTGTPLLDCPVQPGVTAVVTEESRSLWRPRCDRLAFGQQVCFFFHPFQRRPTQEQFAALVAQLLDLKARRGVDLVVFDTLTRMLPLRCENSVEAMQEALVPLTRLTEAGLAVLLHHHTGKGPRTPGQAARGSGALTAFADILLELHPFAVNARHDRRRLLLGFSRLEETPPSLLIELSEDGTRYNVVPEESDSDFPEYWPMLRIVLEDASEPLTRTHIRDRWLEGCPRPSIRTLWNWLTIAWAENLVARQGTGHSNSPFAYYLPHKMPEWRADPIWCLIHRYPEPGTSVESADDVAVGDAASVAAPTQAASATNTSPPPIVVVGEEAPSAVSSDAAPVAGTLSPSPPCPSEGPTVDAIAAPVDAASLFATATPPLSPSVGASPVSSEVSSNVSAKPPVPSPASPASAHDAVLRWLANLQPNAEEPT
jgi:hypothetical protein